MDKATYAKYLASPAWRQRRNAAVIRAEGRCQLCNSKKALNVHHRTYDRIGKERETDLIVLCKACHEHFHGIKDGNARHLSVYPVRPRKPRKARTKRKRVPPGTEVFREAVEIKPWDKFALRAAEARGVSPGSAELAVRTALAKLQGQPATVKRIKERAPHVPEYQIKDVMQWLVQRGEVNEVGKNKWRRRDRMRAVG